MKTAPSKAVQLISSCWQFHRYIHMLRFNDTTAACAAKLTAILSGQEKGSPEGLISLGNLDETRS